MGADTGGFPRTSPRLIGLQTSWGHPKRQYVKSWEGECVAHSHPGTISNHQLTFEVCVLIVGVCISFVFVVILCFVDFTVALYFCETFCADCFQVCLLIGLDLIEAGVSWCFVFRPVLYSLLFGVNYRYCTFKVK